MERGKNNTSLVVIITILAMCVVGLGGYVVYDKVLKKEPIKQETPKDKEEEKNKIEELSLSNDQVQKLYSYVTRGNVGASGCHIEGSQTDYFIKNKNVTNETLEDEMKLKIALLQLKLSDVVDTNETNEGNGLSLKKYKVSEEIINQILDKVFHSKLQQPSAIKKVFAQLPFELKSMSNEESKTPFVDISYQSENKSYLLEMGGGVGWSCGPKTLYTKLIKAIKTNNMIELEAKFFSVNYDSDLNYRVYKDYNNTQEITNNVMKETINPDQYYESGSTITYTFKEGENGNYYFSNSKVNE